MNQNNASQQHQKHDEKAGPVSDWNEFAHDFLVFITQKGLTKRVLWDPEEPLNIDHPKRHLMEQTRQGLLVRDTFGEFPDITLTREALQSGEPIEIGSNKGHRISVR